MPDDPSAGGIAITTANGNVLFLKRGTGSKDHEGEWDWPGGHAQEGESPQDAARRETREETGFLYEGPLREITRTGPDDRYVNYQGRINNEFMPEMDGEHVAYAWAPFDAPPEPLHPGVEKAIKAIEPNETFGDLGVDAKPPKNQVGVDRSAFVYLAPPPGYKFKDQWAQCGPCRKLVPRGQLPALKLPAGKHGCVTLGSRHGVDDDIGSCGEFEPWPGDGTPIEEIVGEHARELNNGAKGAMSPEEAGYVERPVRCENCGLQGNPEATHCGLFKDMAEKLGDVWKDDDNIEAKACCNAQQPKVSIFATDVALAFDRAPDGLELPGKTARVGIAFDRGSARSYDAEGRLHVAVTNISKANICPYVGLEIPGSEELGLDQRKIYKLLRHPDELKRAAATFNRLPLLSRHVPVSADDHQPQLVIGATGSDADFDDPFLRNSLVIWAKDAIEDVEAGVKKELSCAYRYRAEMTPGEYFGEPYDGVMRDIVGNHVALVKEGRAGTDVVVGDEQPQEIKAMATKDPQTIRLTRKGTLLFGALLSSVRPKLAQDSALEGVNWSEIIGDLRRSNYAEQKPGIMRRLKAAFAGKLAKDASLDDVEKVMDMLEAHEPKAVADEGPPEQRDVDDQPLATAAGQEHTSLDEGGEMPAFLKGKVGKPFSEDDYKTVMDMMHGRAKDNDPKLKELGAASDDAGEPTGGSGGPPKFGPQPQKQGTAADRKAMDAAIRTAVDAARNTERAVREAERFVRPWSGELAIACDSAEAVYRACLDTLGIVHKKIKDPQALRTIIELQPKPGSRRHDASLAQDGAADQSFEKAYPDAARVRVL